MVGRVRLTYETADGKRHWVRAFVPALPAPEGVVFVPQELATAVHNHTSEYEATTSTHERANRAMGQDRLPAVSDSQGIRRRSTNRQGLSREEMTRVRS